MSTQDGRQSFRLEVQEATVLRGALNVVVEIIQSPQLEVPEGLAEIADITIDGPRLPIYMELLSRLDTRVEQAAGATTSGFTEVVDAEEAQAIRDAINALTAMLQDPAGREVLVQVGFLVREDQPISEAEIITLESIADRIDPTGVRPGPRTTLDDVEERLLEAAVPRLQRDLEITEGKAREIIAEMFDQIVIAVAGMPDLGVDDATDLADIVVANTVDEIGIPPNVDVSTLESALAGLVQGPLEQIEMDNVAVPDIGEERGLREAAEDIPPVIVPGIEPEAGRLFAAEGEIEQAVAALQTMIDFMGTRLDAVPGEDRIEDSARSIFQTFEEGQPDITCTRVMLLLGRLAVLQAQAWLAADRPEPPRTTQLLSGIDDTRRRGLAILQNDCLMGEDLRQLREDFLQITDPVGEAADLSLEARVIDALRTLQDEIRDGAEGTGASIAGP